MDTHREALGAWKGNHGVVTQEIPHSAHYQAKDTYCNCKLHRLPQKNWDSLLLQFACTHLHLLVISVFSRQLMLLAKTITS